jgi:hypothetical protein
MMGAPQRISERQIREAIRIWRGNVTAAAQSLCMQPKNLRKRLADLGVDLESLRTRKGVGRAEAPASNATHGAQVAAEVSSFKVGPDMVSDSKSTAVLYPRKAERSNLSHMQTVSASTRQEIPIRTAPPRQQPIRLKPAQREAIQRVVFRLQACYGVATDVNLVLEQLVDEELEEWAAKKLQLHSRRKADGSQDEGEDEHDADRENR